VGRLQDLFAGSSVSAYVERARRSMGAGKLADASRVIERGLDRHPLSTALADLRITVQRAQAHTTIRRLEQSIAGTGDPRSYEELIRLYQQLQLPGEARRRAMAYAEAHPDLDTPHLLVGSMYLESFLRELLARHGQAAHDALLRAASLNTMAVQPRLLLAELYFCIGADRSLSRMLHSLEQMSPDQASLEAAREAAGHLPESDREDSFDGLFERIECDGRLERAPEFWPLSKRPARASKAQGEYTDHAVHALVTAEVVDEIVLLRSDNSVVTHATPTGLRGDPDDAKHQAPAHGGLVDLVRTVATKVYPQARELDLGRFDRCTIQGHTSNVVIGRIGTFLTGARCPTQREAHRMWDSVQLALEDGSGGDAQ
jgi:hypothetical protein